MRLATVAAAAEHCGRTQRTIRAYIYSRELDAYRVPGVRATVVDLDQVDRVVAAHSKAPSTVLRVPAEAVQQ